MDRSTTAYLVLHYILLLILIFGVVALIDLYAEGIPLLVGIGTAVLIGLAYPRVLVSIGIAPEQWEG